MGHPVTRVSNPKVQNVRSKGMDKQLGDKAPLERPEYCCGRAIQTFDYGDDNQAETSASELEPDSDAQQKHERPQHQGIHMQIAEPKVRVASGKQHVHARHQQDKKRWPL